jgi:hypothetical protein
MMLRKNGIFLRIVYLLSEARLRYGDSAHPFGVSVCGEFTRTDDTSVQGMGWLLSDRCEGTVK